MQITLAEALDLLDDVSAALETVMLIYGPKMDRAETERRNELVRHAREVCDTHLRPVTDEDDDDEESAAAPLDPQAALASISALIGNVDHSRGGGENTARMYGQMLNDIRSLADAALGKTA